MSDKSSELERLYKVKEDFVRHRQFIKDATIHNNIILTGQFKSIMARLLENEGVEPSKILANGLSHENQVRRILGGLIGENSSKIYDLDIFGVGYGIGNELYSIGNVNVAIWEILSDLQCLPRMQNFGMR